MLVIGLTGGIGSGKSTVAGYFKDLGVPVIDADAIARELVEPGRPALAEIAAAFGREILADNGRLDRARLRHVVFADPAARRQLEAVLHPRIRAVMRERMQGLQSPYCVLCIPLLVETGQTEMVDRVLVVDAPEASQRQRLRQRDQLSDDEIDAVLRSQASRQQRLGLADDIIVNDGDFEALRLQVEQLHRGYLQRAGAAD